MNYNVAVKTRGEDIIFLRKILPGGADRSYGIEVARLAGLPGKVVERSREILRELEAENGVSAPAPAPAEGEQQVSLGSLAESEALKTLRRCQVETMTPMEAMQLLYQLHQKLQ